MMPRMSGYDVARALQDKPVAANIPVIFVTAKSEMEDRVQGLEFAVDYVCKPFAAPELLARVRAALRMRNLQEKLRIANEELTRLAVTDPLTNLCNRRHFDQQLEDDLRRAARFGHPLALISFDLDHFKEINDRYGHAQGDVVLQSFSELLRHSSRRIDTIARVGGEEFAAVLPATDLEGAQAFAEKVRMATANAEIPCRSREGEPEKPLKVQVSAGGVVAHPEPQDEAHIEALAGRVARASDRLLYEAKDAGRNRAVVRAFETESTASPG
jgi:diguanylate cyclase (GGDEF)-like protein